MPTKEGSKFDFLTQHVQIAYAIVLILFIPAALIVNTVLFTQSLKSNIDQVLYDKTIALGEIINVTVQNDLKKPTALQEHIIRIAESNNEIDTLDVLRKEGDDFTIVASLNEEAIGTLDDGVENVLSWHQNTAVAFLAQSENERFWVITMPLENVSKEKEALLAMSVSLEVMDALTESTLIRSYIILTITILVIVLLLAHNARFFEYASLYKKLREVDTMKDEFISIASHELRTPVTGIRGYVSMVLEGTYGKVTGEMKEALETVNSAAERLGVLVEDLLNVSRIEQGRFKIETTPEDPHPLIESTIKELMVQADEKKLTLTYKPHTTPLPMVNLDKDRFKQVIINIVGNAIKYTPKGTVEVVTSLVDNDKKLEIRIKDTGIGMSQKERERLFEKFYRVKNEKTSAVTGTGLGLWITKQIVELMLGTVGIDSIKSVGTQVSITFPISP